MQIRKNMIIKTTKTKRLKREKRHQRLRTKISGTSRRPRLSVFKSHRHIYAQLIDDTSGKTLAQATDLEIKIKGKKSDRAKAVGNLIAKKTKALKIKKVVLDRGGFKYHGRIKKLTEGAREGGLIF